MSSADRRRSYFGRALGATKEPRSLLLLLRVLGFPASSPVPPPNPPVIDGLDLLKKEHPGARDGIRYLEAEFKKGNR